MNASDTPASIGADFAGWRVWRSRCRDDQPSSWVATRLKESAGIEPTVIANTAELLRAALAEQRVLVERTGRRPLTVQVFPSGDAS